MMTPLRSNWAACEARGGSISESIRGRRATKQPAHSVAVRRLPHPWAEWYAQRNRCLEATGVRGLNAQSPSELRWRLRVESGPIYGFDNIMDLGHTISPWIRQPADRYRSANPPSCVDAQGQPPEQLTDGGVTIIWETAH